MQITIYTDGACDIHAENQPGGWAAILRAVDENGELVKETVLSGGAESTTNNQMELTAVIEGLKALKRPSAVAIVTDSRYVIDVASGTKKPVKNKGLWKGFERIAEKHQIDWKYVAGHSGNELNERCDRLAVAERGKFARAVSNMPRQESGIETDIRIYLSTRYDGKDKVTAWAGVILRGGIARDLSGKLANTTELEGTLIAAIESLEALPPGKSATVYTAQEYLSKGMNNWLHAWQARGWKTRNGEPVKYQAHWQKLQELTAGRDLQFRFVKTRGEHPHFQRGKEIAGELLNRD
ncbi:MAG: hypothetical protein OXG78_09975 [Chloroflexi bacterium]|nr:hypothetical protein [Chloroflexota bacterium]